ncbi:MAG: glycosyltransferase family 4 protein [archaeon]
MKVLLIGKLSGGIARHVHYLKKYSKNHVITFTYASDGDYTVPIINIPVLRALSFAIAGFFYGLYCIRKEKPDIIHAHFILPAGFLGMLLSAFTGKKLVLTVHGSDVMKASLLNQLKKIVCRRAKVIAVSQFLADELKKWGLHAKVIPNGIDAAEIRKAKPIRIRMPAVLFVGNLVREKVSFLQDIISPDCNFYIIGGGPLASRLGGIKLGALPPEQVYSYMKSADCLISTSEWEGFGLTILEAMACGLPVICRPRGAAKELADGRALFADSPQEFRSQIEKLLKDPKLKGQLSRKGVQYAGKFDWKETARRTDQLYEV